MFSFLMEVVGCSSKSQLWTRSCGEAGWHIQLLSHPLLMKDSKLPIVLYFLAYHFEKALQTLIWVFARMKAPLTFRNGTRIIRHRQSFLHRKWNKLKYLHIAVVTEYTKDPSVLWESLKHAAEMLVVLLLVTTQISSGQKHWPRTVHALVLPSTHNLLCLLPYTDS